METINIKDYLNKKERLYKIISKNSNLKYIYLDEETKNNKTVALELMKYNYNIFSLFNHNIFTLEDYKDMPWFYFPIFPKGFFDNKECFIQGFKEHFHKDEYIQYMIDKNKKELEK